MVIWRSVMSVAVKFCSNLSFVVTTLLCITRYIQISRPFYEINKLYLRLYILLYLVLYCAKPLLVNTILPDKMWVSYIQEVAILTETPATQTLFYMGIIPQNVHNIIAAVMSVLTAEHVLRSALRRKTGHSQMGRSNLRSSLVIVLLNAANTVWAILLTYSLVVVALHGGTSIAQKMQLSYYDRFRIFATYSFMVHLLSAINPLILLFSSSQIRTFLFASVTASRKSTSNSIRNKYKLVMSATLTSQAGRHSDTDKASPGPDCIVK